MDKENLFNAPYFTSESDDEDAVITALTRRFSRSASIQQPLYILKEKRVFSASPESTLGWPLSTPSRPPFLKADEDAWNLIYAAAGQVARMKMRMSIATATAGVVAHKNNRGLPGASRAFAHPHCSSWGTSDGDEFFRQRQFCRKRGGNESCGDRSPSFPQSAWPPPQQHRPNQPKPCNVPVMKPVVVGGSGGGCDGGGGGKRECAGTGVFLPRRYCNKPPESRKRLACSPANLPARMIQSSSITPPDEIEARINGGFIPQYEMARGGQQQRRSNHHIQGGVKEPVANNPEMLLPQEWTY
ncbi:uncharacterized protein LOC112503390 [Cynara cardunculus var. scolymus]|uniref:uncharacterized protein LOC112503390 n=1 Tax=Cynara cardunculus var. scolymus TaxID=59895 RepID=UPI000D627AB1|nr:uncharacterized protein LOC112503390 [Cynara cardunculus var. scolymus]